ncbi:deoxyuridine 5'-triphosphate nucleotidohydrolase [Desulfonispora thiosulfatigenes DSM 11270]|uniref:Deoxyuridine 5'-triphosphate nucleotidohydrolase n=1 Tax=Desulfonispora thiosulfatigenes DSM 11270 TaxID=656914 RepID=A0A1W1VGP2_DESTI|nr:dUTP diphosphatase [Desulfonispora thiosulfatigenes]SMB92393.1 deoxyuridine 5'-triphosphate nucleotidohydrolase [Desulfonispora thiosulfatigenes DSM 11270]
MYIVKVKKIDSFAKLPQYAHPGDAGLDLYSTEEKIINSGQSALIKTGIMIELPENTEAQIRPRSGLALNYGITVLNTPGTIDEGYRGEICVILINHGKVSFKVQKEMKIAQMVVKPVLKIEVKEVEELTDSNRSKNGFGSSGLI